LLLGKKASEKYSDFISVFSKICITFAQKFYADKGKSNIAKTSNPVSYLFKDKYIDCQKKQLIIKIINF
jgi:hypothetical protein